MRPAAPGLQHLVKRNKQTKKSTTAAVNKPATHTAGGQPAARDDAVPAFQQLLQLVLLFCQWSVLVLRSGSSFPCGTAQPQRKFRSLWAGPSHFAVSWPQARQRWHPPGRWQGAVARRGRSAGDEAKQSPSSSFLAQFQGQLCCRTRPSLLPAARWPGRGWRCRTGLQDVQGRLLSTTTVTSAWGSAESSAWLSVSTNVLIPYKLWGSLGGWGARCGAASVAGICSGSSAICVLPGR